MGYDVLMTCKSIKLKHNFPFKNDFSGSQTLPVIILDLWQ